MKLLRERIATSKLSPIDLRSESPFTDTNIMLDLKQQKLELVSFYLLVISYFMRIVH